MIAQLRIVVVTILKGCGVIDPAGPSKAVALFAAMETMRCVIEKAIPGRILLFPKWIGRVVIVGDPPTRMEIENQAQVLIAR